MAENLAAARLGDDRMDRQKIGRVIELADQFELMLELRADLAVDPFGIAQRRLFPSEPLEFLLRRPGGIAHLVGILIFELVEAECAAACKFNGSERKSIRLNSSPELE